MLPGAMDGDVMMAELEGRDHWRVGKACAVRVHVEPRYAEYSPAFDGDVPEGFSAAAPCKVRKRFVMELSRTARPSTVVM